jgi:seryl-tRNA synthetase
LIDEESVEEFDEIEENIRKLKEERDKIKFKIQRKEERKMKKLNDLNDRIETLKFDYKEIQEDRKINYLEIQGIRDQINDIMNHNRCIILDDSSSKMYTVITDYEPIHGNEITEDNQSINEDSNSGSNSGSNKNSGTNSGTNKNSKISLEVENLD